MLREVGLPNALVRANQPRVDVREDGLLGAQREEQGAASNKRLEVPRGLRRRVL